MALKRLRRWARDGADEELDLDGTIRATAEHGYLDVKTRPERRNAVKVLLFLDVGGSMDPHIKVVEELFSAARSEFKHHGILLFPQLPLRRRLARQPPPLGRADPTWKCCAPMARITNASFVGDASMSPYEIAYPGGANEHWNAESGQVWLDRAREQWPAQMWINPVPEKYWGYTHSIGMIREIFEERMVPMTLKGIEQGMRELTR